MMLSQIILGVFESRPRAFVCNVLFRYAFVLKKLIAKKETEDLIHKSDWIFMLASK